MKYWLTLPKVFLVLLIPISGFGALPDTWNIRTAPSSNHLQGVAYGHGLFIAVGDQNTILTSPTGTDWMQRTSGVSVLHSATTGNGWFVAGGQEAALIRSSRDGINWTNGIGTTGLQRVFGFTHANNLFVGVGRGTRSDNSFSSYVVTSRNAIDWDYPFLPTTNTLLAVTHGTNLFVAVGEVGTIITSTDGTTWTVRNSGTLASLRAIAFHQSRFIAAGDGGIVLASPDGISWSAAPPASFDIRALASGPGALVAVGSFGSSGRLQASPDGLSWPGTSRAFGQPLNAIVYGPGSFVASGDGGLILQSEDSANYWTKPSSGYWEEPYWSLGQLPSSNQAAIVFINPGWKALAIGSSSTANYPDSLPIQRLIVGAPADSFNQLLLNYAGLSVPLNIASDLTVDRNGSLASYYSSLRAGSLSLSGPATFSEQSAASFDSVVVGEAAPGELNISNASVHAGTVLVGSAAPGTINQYGGTNLVDDKLSINGQSIYNMTNGVLDVGTLFLAEENRPGWTGRFNGTGGSIRVRNSLRLGRRPDIQPDARGEFALMGGNLQTPAIEFENSTFVQNGGTNLAQIINMPSPGGFGWADYDLGGSGVLVSEQVTIGTYSLGYFVQTSGSIHTNSIRMTLGGRTTGTNHSFQGTYALLGGLVFSPQIMLEGGQFIQQGGTNQTQRVMVDLTGSFGLTGGTLSSSNTSVHSFGAASRSLLSSFVQSGGNHTVQNYLTVDGVYRLQGGSLVASNIYVEIDGELHLDGGSASNPGFFTMDNGTCYAQGQNHNLGKLRVLSTGALPRFSDGPWVCTLDLQSAGTVVRFLDSHDVSADWSGTLVIKNWSGSTNGGGTDQVYVGTTAQGLTAAQLGRIVFVNPDAMPGANYPARILSTGEIVPAARPPLSFAPSSGKLVLSWTGNYQLVTAINVNGPYTLVPGASSPYTNSFVDPQRFFRLKSP